MKNKRIYVFNKEQNSNANSNKYKFNKFINKRRRYPYVLFLRCIKSDALNKSFAYMPYMKTEIV